MPYVIYFYLLFRTNKQSQLQAKIPVRNVTSNTLNRLHWDSTFLYYPFLAESWPARVVGIYVLEAPYIDVTVTA